MIGDLLSKLLIAQGYLKKITLSYDGCILSYDFCVSIGKTGLLLLLLLHTSIAIPDMREDLS